MISNKILVIFNSIYNNRPLKNNNIVIWYLEVFQVYIENRLKNKLIILEIWIVHLNNTKKLKMNLIATWDKMKEHLLIKYKFSNKI